MTWGLNVGSKVKGQREMKAELGFGRLVVAVGKGTVISTAAVKCWLYALVSPCSRGLLFVVADVILCLTVRSLSCVDAWNGRTALSAKGNLASHHHREGAERLYLQLAFVG